MGNWLKRARCEIPAVEGSDKHLRVDIDTAESAGPLA
jgi:hypothetical protein